MGLFSGKKEIGSNDSAIEAIGSDLFEIRQYVDGLAMFIRKCVTPMTVSIQGDWGSGKTSIMNMIKEELGDSVIPVWFNTWQYSQFNMGEDLPLSLLGRLIKELKQSDPSSERIKTTMKAAFKAVKKAGQIAASQVVGSDGMQVLNAFAEDFVNGNDDVTNAIDSLKKDFQEFVNEAIEKQGKDRVIIFIDDLDRLEPIKAVELLEVLKVFLDCEHCVFVLAIDYSVISIGVKQKYGELIGADKGKSFFDKIIQVPFKMPVAHYQLRNYVREMFRQVEIDLKDDAEADIYVDLIQHSVGCNPRTMKRLFNAYLLLLCIGNNVNITAKIEDPSDGVWYRKMMFAILCCQHAYEDLYTFLVRNREDILEGGNIWSLRNPETYRNSDSTETDMAEEEEEDEPVEDSPGEVLSLLWEKFKNASDDLIARMAEFMELFLRVIDENDDEKLDEEKERAALKELLSLSAITMAGNNEEQGAEERTRGGSLIVPSVADLEMGNLSNEKKAEIAQFLKSLGKDVEISFVKGAYSHIVAKVGSRKSVTFADVYGKKNGYRVYIYVPKANIFTHSRMMPEIAEWVKAHGLEPKKSSNPKSVSYSVTNAEEEASLKLFVENVYQAWIKYGKK